MRISGPTGFGGCAQRFQHLNHAWLSAMAKEIGRITWKFLITSNLGPTSMEESESDNTIAAKLSCFLSCLTISFLRR